MVGTNPTSRPFDFREIANDCISLIDSMTCIRLFPRPGTAEKQPGNERSKATTAREKETVISSRGQSPHSCFPRMNEHFSFLRAKAPEPRSSLFIFHSHRLP